jgi:hypothetical protein
MVVKRKCYVINIISSVVLLRGIWLIRNDFIFNKQEWVSVKQVLRRMLRLTKEWMVIVKEAKREEMKNLLSFLDKAIREPLRIPSA